MARVQGRASEGPVDVGFQLPPEGCNDYVVCEPIEEGQNEEKTRSFLKIPLKVASKDESIDGIQFMIFLTTEGGEAWEKKSSEQRIADVLSAIRVDGGKFSQMEVYDKKYPNEPAWLTPTMVNAYKTDLPGKYLMLNIKLEKNKKDPTKEQAKIMQIGPVGSGKVGETQTKTKETKAAPKTNIPEDF